MHIKVLFILASLTLVPGLHAQDDYPYPSLSPKGTITQTVGNTQITIEYERPSARNRVVFGELVPWNEVWRTGAGQCTRISFDNYVEIGEHSIPPGKYALLSIPNRDEWIILINRDTTLYGSYHYDPADDIARFPLKSTETSRFYEALTIDIELIPNNAKIYISWENTQVAFEVKTSTDEEIEDFIQKELMTGKETRSDIYAGAAEYHYYRGTNLPKALELTGMALAIDENNGWARDLRIRTFLRMEQYEEALQEIELTIENINSTRYDNQESRDRDVRRLREWSDQIRTQMKE